MRIRLLTLGLLLALALPPALAGGWGRQERREPPRQQQQRQMAPQMYGPRQEPMRPPPGPPPGWQGRPPMMSNGQAAQRAQQINGGGRVLAVDPAQNGYRVRVLKDGEVRSVYVPPQ